MDDDSPGLLLTSVMFLLVKTGLLMLPFQCFCDEIMSAMYCYPIPVVRQTSGFYSEFSPVSKLIINECDCFVFVGV